MAAFKSFALIVLLAATAVAGCAAQLPVDVEALKKDDKALVVTSAGMAGSNVEVDCFALKIVKVAALHIPDAGRLQQISNEFLGSRQLLPFSLEAGTYAVTEVRCNGKPRLILHAPRNASLATFTVSAGEIVNIGRITIIEHFQTDSGWTLGKPKVHFAVVTDLKPEERTTLKPEVAPRMVARLASPTLKLPPAEARRLCDRERKQFDNGIPLPTSKFDPLICRLAASAS